MELLPDKRQARDLRKLNRLEILQIAFEQAKQNDMLEALLKETQDSLQDVLQVVERLKGRLNDKDIQIEHLKERMDEKDGAILRLSQAIEQFKTSRYIELQEAGNITE